MLPNGKALLHSPACCCSALLFALDLSVLHRDLLDLDFCLRPHGHVDKQHAKHNDWPGFASLTATKSSPRRSSSSANNGSSRQPASRPETKTRQKALHSSITPLQLLLLSRTLPRSAAQSPTHCLWYFGPAEPSVDTLYRLDCSSSLEIALASRPHFVYARSRPCIGTIDSAARPSNQAARLKKAVPGLSCRCLFALGFCPLPGKRASIPACLVYSPPARDLYRNAFGT